MGKVKFGLYCYLTADILTRVLQKSSLNSPLPNILFLSIPLNLFGCHGNRNAKFPLKIISSEAIRGIKLKLCRNVCLISLYKNDFVYCCWSDMCFHCYGKFKFPFAYNGKMENWPLLLSHCRYFDNRFTEMFSFFILYIVAMETERPKCFIAI